MIIHLPKDRERSVLAAVQSGRFASVDDAMTEAASLLRRQLRQDQPASKALTPDELNRQLLEAGLLSQMPTKPDPATYRGFTPIAIEGEPLSETIIRERR